MTKYANIQANVLEPQAMPAALAGRAPGDLYAVCNVGGHELVVRYGYAGESTRVADLIPLFPNLVEEELYDEAGWRIACAVNEGCEFYRGAEGFLDDGACMTCRYYPDDFPDFGICSCRCRRKKPEDEDGADEAEAQPARVSPQDAPPRGE
ncbi:MAG TPA: hypothetical protein DCP91_12280 [Eggerthellaceae bacterium]|nr:hypothetical protein [Eggerthellaceae bacterium]